MFGDGRRGARRRCRDLIPIYPLTAKLYSWDLQQVDRVALDLVDGVPDVLTPELRDASTTCSTSRTALRWIHRPDD